MLTKKSHRRKKEEKKSGFISFQHPIQFTLATFFPQTPLILEKCQRNKNQLEKPRVRDFCMKAPLSRISKIYGKPTGEKFEKGYVRVEAEVIRHRFHCKELRGHYGNFNTSYLLVCDGSWRHFQALRLVCAKLAFWFRITLQYWKDFRIPFIKKLSQRYAQLQQFYKSTDPVMNTTTFVSRSGETGKNSGEGESEESKWDRAVNGSK